MLTQPGHIDEQLKEGLKSKKEENRKCLLKIVQSISILFPRASKMRSQISSSSSFKLKIMKCFESGLKSYDKHMIPNTQNEILQIMALKVVHGIASDGRIWILPVSWLMRALM